MKNVKGFTLIEVLVSVLILSTGLLGLVGLQTAGMRNIIGSYNRTQASQLASGMADRIRANVADLNAGTTGGTSIYATKGNPLTVTAPASPNPCLTAGNTTCDPAAMAQNDLYQWSQALNDTSNGLVKTGTITVTDPNGAAVAVCPQTAPLPFQVTVTVSWSEGRDDDKNGTIDPDLAFQTIFQIPRYAC